MASLYKSEQGKKEILELYDTKLSELNIDFEYLTISTIFGKTNIVATGNIKNPTLIIVHGSNGCAPVALEAYPNLTKKYRVLAIDVLAQPNKSAETLLNMKDNSYGKWMNEVIDKLKINQVTLAGFSFGGLVILKTLEYKETKIKQVFLSSPAYIVNGNPIKAMFKVFIPMKRYIKSKNEKHVKKVLDTVFTDWNNFALQYLSKVFLHFNMDFSPIPVIKKTSAQEISTPIFLFAGKNDIMFPGQKMIKRAKKIFPSLKETILLEHSKHVQSKSDNKKIVEIIKE